MSLSQARTFLKRQIAIIEPDLKEWKDSFNTDNIPQTKIDDYFHINFGELSSAQADNWIQDNWTCTVTIWKRGFSDVSSSFDSIIDTANCIRLKVIDPKAILTDNIHSIESNSITPEPIEDSNDNTIKVSLEFNIKLFFTTS